SPISMTPCRAASHASRVGNDNFSTPRPDATAAWFRTVKAQRVSSPAALVLGKQTPPANGVAITSQPTIRLNPLLSGARAACGLRETPTDTSGCKGDTRRGSGPKLSRLI